MSKINFSTTASNVTITPDSNRLFSVEIDGAEKDDILDAITIEDAIAHFGVDVLLTEIGQSECQNHFDLVPNDQ